MSVLLRTVSDSLIENPWHQDVLIGRISTDTCFARDLAYTKVVQGRLYTCIVYHAETLCYAAVSTFSAPFEIYQEEGEPLYPYDAERALPPTGPRSALELIEAGSWRTIDGYEFRQYETALSVANVKLETKSTESGTKEYLAVGTIISRGEDLASRGAVSGFSVPPSYLSCLTCSQLYVFEIVMINAARGELTPRRSLRLLFHEDLKAPIANVSALNHYLLHSVGLKVRLPGFPRARCEC